MDEFIWKNRDCAICFAAGNEGTDKNADGMVAFSSRGPTSDGRIKPDVVAPGTFILSTLSRDVMGRAGWADSEDPLYFFEGGTSMSTPLVAGCAAVVTDVPPVIRIKISMIQ